MEETPTVQLKGPNLRSVSQKWASKMRASQQVGSK